MSDVRVIRHKDHYYVTRGQVTRVMKSKRPYTHAFANGSSVHFSTSEDLARKSIRLKYPDHTLIPIKSVPLDDFR